MGRTLTKVALAALAAGAFTTPVALAEGEFSSNVALTTDYVWRGFSQNSENPAVQGGFDYANGLFYAGTWASVVDYGGANLELDLYGGFAGETDGGLAWDVGVIGYLYPDTDDLDFIEIYGGLGYSFGPVDASGYVYLDPDNENTYIEGALGYGISDNVSVDASLGNYSFDGGDDYTAYSIGGTFSTEVVDFDLRFWGTDVDDEPLADDRVVLTISRSM